MGLYEVTYRITTYETIKIEADSPEEASEKAKIELADTEEQRQIKIYCRHCQWEWKPSSLKESGP